MQTRLREHAYTRIIDGWLELYAPGAESNTGYRIPGTEHKYKCKEGWEREDYTNPDNLIQCQGSRKADFSAITLKCIRKITIVLTWTKVSHHDSNDLQGGTRHRCSSWY